MKFLHYKNIAGLSVILLLSACVKPNGKYSSGEGNASSTTSISMSKIGQSSLAKIYGEDCQKINLTVLSDKAQTSDKSGCHLVESVINAYSLEITSKQSECSSYNVKIDAAIYESNNAKASSYKIKNLCDYALIYSLYNINSAGVASLLFKMSESPDGYLIAKEDLQNAKGEYMARPTVIPTAMASDWGFPIGSVPIEPIPDIDEPKEEEPKKEEPIEPTGPSQAEVAAAQTVFDANCTGCHSVRNFKTNSLAEEMLTNSLKVGTVSARINANASSSVRVMPPNGAMKSSDLQIINEFISKIK